MFVFSPSPHLVLTLAKQLLLAQVIDPQQLPDSHQDSSLERRDSQRDVLYGGLPSRTEADYFRQRIQGEMQQILYLLRG